jgi:hypothetical protein
VSACWLLAACWPPAGWLLLGCWLSAGWLVAGCGLVVAGPVAMIFGSMASPEFRLKEATIFAAIMTTFCILLFKILLRLPIPVIGPVLEPFLPL